MSRSSAALISSFVPVRRRQLRLASTTEILLRLFGFLLVLIWLSVPVASGQTSASLWGTVTDSSGASIAGASVTVRNLETGEVRETQTDTSGQYRVIALPIGEYEVHVRKSGFTEQVQTGIHLVVGQVTSANLELRVGEVTQQIKVESDAPMATVTTADISGLVGERQIKDLPLNGRSYDLLLPLNPGTVNFTSQKTGCTGISNSTTANNFAVSGNRPQQNLFLLNGVEYTGAAENNMQPGARAACSRELSRCGN